jgi:exopolyphosphatase/guanosine-5'-triphosphate,3'-diphosphate pyrophosphatase
VKLAAIDLGSNTLKYTLAEIDSAGGLAVLDQDAEITRIGQDLDKNGYLLDAAMDRTFDALRTMVESARTNGASKIACVATAGMRGASNAPDFLRRAKDELALTVEIIGGLREAELAFKAPAAAHGEGPLLVFDVGGRSTEIIYGTWDGIQDRVSLEIGAVRLTERFLASDPPTLEQVQALQAYVRQALKAAPTAPSTTPIIGVSGTVMSLLGLQMGIQDMGRVVSDGEGQTLSLESANQIFQDLRAKPAKARISGSVVPAGRADVIVAGAAIVLATMAHYGVPGMTVSNRGVRFGLLFEMTEAL